MAFSLKELMLNEMRRTRIRSLGSKQSLWPSQARVKTFDNQIIGQCLRASYWAKNNEPQTNPVSEEVMLMGYMGTKIEDGVIEITKNNGIWENNNVKWQAYGLSGEVDIILRVKEPNEQNAIVENLYIVECKSCSGYFPNKEVFGYNKGAGANKQWVPGKPKDKHLMQGAIYAYVGKEKFKGTIIIYVSRDESRLMEFLITLDDEGRIYINGNLEYRFTIHDILKSYEELQAAIDTKTLPARDYKPAYTNAEVASLYEKKEVSKAVFDSHNDGSKPYSDKECSYCPYKNKCLNPNLVTAAPAVVETVVKKTASAEWDFFDKQTDITKEKPAYILSGSF